MDARDRLRRYLEQRRELGESEFVLDGLPVDEALRLLGSRQSAPSRTKSDGTAGRSARSAADVVPTHGDAPDQPPAPSMAPPAAPERRFAEGASTDWRETLRNSGGTAPGTPPGAPPAKTSGTQPAPAASRPDAPARAAASSMAMPAWLAALDIPPGLETGRTSISDIAPQVAALPSLEAVAAHVAQCTACALFKSARNPVPGEGNPRAEFLCVGEAPGATEDEQGRPFVGEAGQLLTKILGAIQLTRDDVYICNVLKHRPPGNRDPLPDEVASCQPYLLRQIELVRPKVILALGRFAAQTLLHTTDGIGALRGKVHRYHGVPLIVTYHPAALLRNEQWKRPTWEDVKLARRVLDASRAATSGTE